MGQDRPVTTPISLSAFGRAELFKLLVDSVEDYAIFLLDPMGRVSSWNKGAKKLKGYKPHEIIGKHFSVFYDEKDIAEDKPGRKLAICSRMGRVEDEGWRIRMDGSRFWANVVITALHDENGTLIGYAKVTRDLSERKKLEDAQREFNEQLLNQRLKLQELNSIKDEFISLASHQLRTPATGVKQFIGLLLEGFAGELTEKQKDFLHQAQESNNRQINLINDMLQVAQVDAGKVTLRKTATDIGSLINDVVAEQQNTFQKRRQHVVVNIEKEPCSVNLDSSRFRMVIENLIDNASKYTPQDGSISVKVSCSNKELFVAISDSGVGIDAAALSTVFSKFARIPNELSDSVGGTGLGLYWAQKIIELHGGHIDVKSKAGLGSTFTVRLPLGGTSE